MVRAGIARPLGWSGIGGCLDVGSVEFEPTADGKVGGEGERFLLRCKFIVNVS